MEVDAAVVSGAFSQYGWIPQVRCLADTLRHCDAINTDVAFSVRTSKSRPRTALPPIHLPCVLFFDTHSIVNDSRHPDCADSTPAIEHHIKHG